MKKIIIRAVVIFLSGLSISLLGGWYVYDNIKTYSIYYAKHMPRGEGEEPELIMLIENLEWIDQPEIDGIKYDMDGTNDIIDINDNKKMFGNIYNKETNYVYFDQQGNYYKLNKHMELLYTSDANSIATDIKVVDRKKVIEEIKEFVNPIIKAQSKPYINLQFIFNWLYEDEFNER